MKAEKTWDEAMESVYKIMLEEWSKEEIIEYIRCRDGYTKNDMTALPIKEFKCKDVYGQEYVLSYTDAPMVDYAPVKHGYWQRITVQPYFRKHFAIDVACSLCHIRGDERYNFCPNCGAKMDGKGKDDEIGT